MSRRIVALKSVPALLGGSSGCLPGLTLWQENFSAVKASGDIASRRRSSGLSETNSWPRRAIFSTDRPFLIVVAEVAFELGDPAEAALGDRIDACPLVVVPEMEAKHDVRPQPSWWAGCGWMRLRSVIVQTCSSFPVQDRPPLVD